MLFLACVSETRRKSGPKELAQARTDLGLSLIREGDLQGGLKELLIAVELDPQNPEIHNALGLAYRGLGDVDKAVLHFQKALAINPAYPEAQNNLGSAYASAERWDEAIGMFEKATADITYRTRHYAYENLGSVYHYQGEYRRAIEYYRKALELSPQYSSAYDKMGLSYEKLREWDAAVQAYEKSIEFAPDFPPSYLHLGKLYLQLNRPEKAKENLLKAMENDRAGVYAIEARRLLDAMQPQKGSE